MEPSSDFSSIACAWSLVKQEGVVELVNNLDTQRLAVPAADVYVLCVVFQLSVPLKCGHPSSQATMNSLKQGTGYFKKRGKPAPPQPPS